MREDFQASQKGGEAMKFWIALASGLLLLTGYWIAVEAGEQRTWNAAAGGHSAVGEFVELKPGGLVCLRLADGKLRDVPLEKLSAADRDYVRAKTASGAATNPAVETQRSDADNLPPATLGDLRRLEAEAQNCKTARAAAQLYAAFLARPNLSPEVQRAAEENLNRWQTMARTNMVRLGKKWVHSDQYAATRRQARDLIKHSLELVRLNQDKLAYEKLIEASKLDPDSIQADFIMGIVFALVVKNYDKANEHFENCRRRDADNIAVLNNLALTEIKLGQVRNAINHWKAAIAVGHDQRVAQNLGRLIHQAGKGRVSLPKSAISQLSELYTGMMASDRVEGASMRHGWQYMMIAEEEPETAASASESSTYSSTVGAFGTGFVIADHYLLTNRHVAQSATGFDIIEPNQPTGAPLPATLVAMCDTADLAILRCEGLRAPPVPLDPFPLRRGTDMMLLGYPEPTVLGAGLKSTRGSISALASNELDGMCLYDAVTNPGNSGGPVCDSRANVIAIHCAGYQTASRYGAGIPIAAAMPFIQTTLPEIRLVSAGTQSLPWPDVDERVSKSTVLILVKVKEQDVGLASRAGRGYLEDRSCPQCSGLKTIKCPVRRCARGTVPEVEVVVTGRTPQGAPIYGENPIRVRCPNCGGRGVVGCPLCHGSGQDPEL